MFSFRINEFVLVYERNDKCFVVDDVDVGIVSRSII